MLVTTLTRCEFVSNFIRVRVLTAAFAFFVCVSAVISVHAQTTEFVFQGSLKNNGLPANGDYDFEFKLFDVVSGGVQQGSTLQRLNVAVASGIFTASLDFGAGTLPGADRFLDIAVRTAGGGAFTALTPRQKVNSAPYSVKSLNSTTAGTAINSTQLGGVNASEYVTTTSGGNSFVRNATTQQTADLNISGNGFFGGSLGIGTTAPQSKLSVQTGNGYGFTQTSGAVTVGSYISGGGGWYGTRSNNPLFLFTNDGLPQVTLQQSGNLGIGTTVPTSRLDVSGNLTLESGTSPLLFTGRGTTEQNRYLQLLNSSALLTASGLKAGGILVADDYNFANPGKNDLIVKGNVGIGAGAPSTYGHGGTNKIVEIQNSASAPNSQSHAILSTGATSAGTSIGSVTWAVPNTAGVEKRAALVASGLEGSAAASITSHLSFWTTNAGAIGERMKITADGNITQPIAANGLVKAMIYVNINGGIVRCYNGITNSSTGNCGFTILGGASGLYQINFGFPASGRFVSITPFGSYQVNIGASFFISPPNGIDVRMFATDVDASGSGLPHPFMIIVY